MQEPLNPYAPPAPTQDDLEEDKWRQKWPIRGILFVDAFAIGTRLMTGQLGVITAVVCTVWIPVNLGLAYYDYYVIAEDDFRSSFRMARFAQWIFGSLADACVLSIGVAQVRGETISYRSAFATGASYWGRFFGGSFLIGISLFVGLVLLIVPGIYVGVCTAYFFPLVVAENERVMDGLQRSFEVGKKRFWASMGIIFSATAVTILAGVVAGAIAVALSLAPLPESAVWICEGLLNVPVDLIHAWSWLVVLGAYYCIQQESGRSVPVFAVPSEQATT